MSATRTDRAPAPAPGLRTAGLMSVAGGLVAALHLLGRGSLPWPPLTTPTHLGEWVEQHGAAVTAMSLLRFAALAGGWYTLAAAALHLLAAATRSNPLDSLARCVTVRPLRRVLVAAGAGVTATALGAAAAPLSLAAASRLPQAASSAQQAVRPAPATGLDTSASHTAPPTSTGEGPPPTTSPGSTASLRRVRPGAPGTASLRRIRPGPVTVEGQAAQVPAPTTTQPSATNTTEPHATTTQPSATTTQPSATTTHPNVPRNLPPAPESPAPAMAGQTPSPALDVHGSHNTSGEELTWTVQPGDNFWSIAAGVLRTGWGHEPSDSDVYRYWRLLVDANRSRLLRQGDPNLIFAGQLFVLPALPPPDQPR